MRILGRQDRGMTTEEFLAFVKAMSRELADIANERKLADLAKALNEVNRLVYVQQKFPQAAEP